MEDEDEKYVVVKEYQMEKPNPSEVVAEVLGGLGLGITLLLMMALVWVPLIAILVVEWNWWVK